MTKKTQAKTLAKKVAKKTLGSKYKKVVRSKHYGVALGANIKRRFPGRKLKVIGVTGTNGKTTTCHLIHSVLCQKYKNVGLITTTSYGLNQAIVDQKPGYTTPRIELILDQIVEIRKKADQELDWLVLEVTSHALDQFRIFGIPIDIAVMTNVTHEHLDYHGSFEKYLQTKLRLFKAAARHRSGHRLGVVNYDDPSVLEFVDEVPNVLLYSLKRLPLEEISDNIACLYDLKSTANGSDFVVRVANEEYQISCNIPGVFNVANCLAAVLATRAVGLDSQQINRGIKSLKGVDGRMTTIDLGQKFNVIVDFAHTPDGFEKFFASISGAAKGGRLITVFGAAGERYAANRALMGEVAGQQADLIIITEDDYRNENPQTIAEEIARGAQKSGKTLGKNIFIEIDRKKAIERALSQAKAKDIVAILGKGHEKIIYRKDRKDPWSDIKTTKTLLKKQLQQKKK